MLKCASNPLQERITNDEANEVVEVISLENDGVLRATRFHMINASDQDKLLKGLPNTKQWSLFWLKQIATVIYVHVAIKQKAHLPSIFLVRLSHLNIVLIVFNICHKLWYNVYLIYWNKDFRYKSHISQP